MCHCHCHCHQDSSVKWKFAGRGRIPPPGHLLSPSDSQINAQEKPQYDMGWVSCARSSLCIVGLGVQKRLASPSETYTCIPGCWNDVIITMHRWDTVFSWCGAGLCIPLQPPLCTTPGFFSIQTSCLSSSTFRSSPSSVSKCQSCHFLFSYSCAKTKLFANALRAWRLRVMQWHQDVS